MTVRVHIKPIIYRCANGLVVTEVEGDTVGQCLSNVAEKFPGIEKDLFDKRGKLLSYVNIFVDGKIAYPENLTKAVNDGDDIYVVPMIEGG